MWVAGVRAKTTSSVTGAAIGSDIVIYRSLAQERKREIKRLS